MVPRGAVLLYQQLLKCLEQPHVLLVSLFQLRCSGLQYSRLQNSRGRPQVTPGVPQALGEAMLPSCSVEHILHNWSCTDGSKCYHSSHLLFDLLKVLLCLRVVFKSSSLQSVDKANSQAAIWLPRTGSLGSSFDLTFRIIRTILFPFSNIYSTLLSHTIMSLICCRC